MRQVMLSSPAYLASYSIFMLEFPVFFPMPFFEIVFQ